MTMKGNILLSVLVAAPLLTACGMETDQTAQVDQASSVHLKGGRNAEPSFRDLGLALRSSGALSGLGGGDVYISLDATANATTSCQNPGNGEHYPPGQEPAPIDVSGSTLIPEEEIKNGTTNFTVTTNPPASTVAGAPDCPNPQWIEHVIDLAFTSATITVEQPEGTTVLTVDCTFSSPTTNGSVPAGNVSCTSY
jgi:hypothetical protein